jgi:hypothetical protein
MSLILDALKRAERERRLERPPDLTAVYEEDHLPRRGIRPWLWLSGVFLVGVIAVGLILWPEGPGSDRPPVPTEPSVARSAPAAAPAGKEEIPPSPASPKSTVPKPAEVPPVQASPLQPAPASAQASLPQPAAPAPVPEIPPAQAAKTAVETPDKEPPTPAGAISASPAAPVLSTGETGALQPRAPATPAPAGPPAQPAPSEPVPSPPPPADPKTEASPGKPPSIPLLSELPFEVRQKLGSLQINVHSYSKNPAERLVFINMKNFKVGDRIGENGPVLKEITPEGVIIDYGEGQTRVQVWR